MKRSYISLFALLLPLAFFAVYVRCPTAHELERRQTAIEGIIRGDPEYTLLQAKFWMNDGVLQQMQMLDTARDAYKSHMDHTQEIAFRQAQKSELERKLSQRRAELLPCVVAALENPRAPFRYPDPSEPRK